MTYALIMAGGIGSRFWPESRMKKPKQFLDFFQNRSPLQMTVDRILPFIPIDRILVSTNESYVHLVKEQIPDLPSENIIGEPSGKNTAPCIGFAAALLHYRDPDSTMIVLPSDHYIPDRNIFLEDIQAAVSCAHQNDTMVTIGVQPVRPETGFGYIQYEEYATLSMNQRDFFKVKTFAEKPDAQTAIKFLESGDFLWNSGIFIWKSHRILQEIEQHLPVLSYQVQIFSRHLEEKHGSISRSVLEEVYNSSFSVSIDYGIMEKSANVIVLPSSFSWSDLGSWNAIYELNNHHKDPNGNLLQVPHSVTLNSRSCMIKSNSKKLFALVGLEGICVIDTEDAMLICRLNDSQQVRELYDVFKEKFSSYC